MELTSYKKIEIELSHEEVQVLENARKIIHELNYHITDEKCNYVLCEGLCYDSVQYSSDDLDNLENQLELLQVVQEIY